MDHSLLSGVPNLSFRTKYETYKWDDRMVIQHLHMATFAYCVSFAQECTSLGLSLKTQIFPFGSNHKPQLLSCCVVTDARQCPSKIVRPEDLILSCNGTPLFGINNSCDGAVERFNDSIRIIGGLAGKSRLVRFLRGAGLPPNMSISPAEIMLLADENQKPSATFTVSSGSVGRLMEMQSDLPVAIQRMLGGADIAWDNRATIPGIRGAQLASQGGGPTLHRLSADGAAQPAQTPSSREGIYKDDRSHLPHHKWSAIIHIPDLDTYRILGHFQSEVDAEAAYNHAKQEVMATGNYTGRWLKQRSQEALTLNLSPGKEIENSSPGK